MRVAVVYISSGKHRRLENVAKALSKGIDSQGEHRVDLFDISRNDDCKLSSYQYIAIGAEFSGLFRPSAPVQLSRFLHNAGLISGKRCFAFTVPRAFGTQKALSKLMIAMENEGMFIKFSEILRDEADAELCGAGLSIES